MDFLYHLFAVRKIFGEEVHRVPEVIAAPILPVLDDAIERHLEFAVFGEDGEEFLATLVTLLRLPIAESPQREHRHLSRKRPHLRDNAVCRAAVHKIIVFIVGNFRGKLHTFRRAVKLGRGIIVPENAPAFDALQHILKVLKIRLFHQNVRVSAAEFAVLNGAEAVDLLVLFEEKTLSEFVGVALHRAGTVFEGEGFFRQ